MSVIGIDLGNENAVIAQAVRGGVDVILNESSKRLTPTLVSFVGNERYLGEQATTQVRTNMANTVGQLKRILGRKFAEPEVQRDLETFLNYRARALPTGDIGVDAFYNGETQTFTPTQLMAMFLTKAKEIIQLNNPTVATSDVVLSVPAYYTEAQRRALLDAATIAGFNCLRLLNEGTAAALSYGIYKSAKREFPEGKETKVMFLDMGHGHFTCTIAAFTNQSLRIVASESDAHIGGRELDAAIAKYFADEFQQKTGVDAWTDRKARVKLFVAAEKAKITITPFGVNTARASVECLKDDRDFSGSLTLEKMEELAVPFVKRMQECIQRAMSTAGVASVADLMSVELVGGGMRPRPLKRAAATVLGLPLNEETGHGLSTSMNLDECISRGCALACAMLSPIFRVKPFEITDIVPYPVRVSWEAAASDAAAATSPAGDMDVEEEKDAVESSSAASSTSTLLFKPLDATPIVRRVTFRRSHAFDLVAEYDTCDATGVGAERLIAKYTISGFPEDAVEAGQPAPRVRVDFRHDLNGTFSVVKAELLKEIKEAAPAPEAAAPADAAAPAGAEATAPAPAAPAKKRVKRVELTVTATLQVGAMSRPALAEAIASEGRMRAQDADIHATHDVRNSLEAYVYNTRDALYGDLGMYGSESVKEALTGKLDDAESWLYDNMEADKATFQAKLAELKSVGGPLYSRKYEAEHRAEASKTLLDAVETYRAVLNDSTGKYAHLLDTDRDALRAACSEAENWFRSKQEAQAALQLWDDVVFTVADINAKRETLVRECRPIANKPVPPPAAAPAPAPVPAAAEAPAPAAPETADAPAAAEPKMEVD